ncbi:hypothetical protein [Salinisphaera sp. T5B8]|uniref:sulfotransferase family protein n=1 Tax=Salinisphaera sp. T5B8 TaxID=1304154 RepID=UPI0033410338
MSEAPESNNRSTAVVVLGAGRSGTSALTRGLGALGIDLGDKLRAPGGKNPTGFYEDEDILVISKRLKRALGIRGHSVRLLDEDVWTQPAVKKVQRDAIHIIGERFGKSPLWGYKYGRTLRTLPFWDGVFDALDLDVRYVMPLRNPLSVARSRARLNPQRGRQVWSDMEWLVNVVPYFHRVRGMPLSIVDFDRLMAEPRAQLERIARDLSLPLDATVQAGIDTYAKDFVRPDMPRSRFSRDDLRTDPAVNRWVAEGYGLLDRVAADEMRIDDPGFWAEWQPIQDAVNALGPLLGEFDYMNKRLAHAQWNPTSPVPVVRQIWRDLRNR